MGHVCLHGRLQHWFNDMNLSLCFFWVLPTYQTLSPLISKYPIKILIVYLLFIGSSSKTIQFLGLHMLIFQIQIQFLLVLIPNGTGTLSIFTALSDPVQIHVMINLPASLSLVDISMCIDLNTLILLKYIIGLQQTLA